MAAHITQLGAVAVEIEDTKGTAKVPATADAAIEVEDPDWDVVVEHFERNPIHPAMDRPPSVPGPTMVEFSFAVPWAGAEAAGTAPMYDKVLRACALSETIAASTVRYHLVSDESLQETATIDLYRGGAGGSKRLRVAGAMLNPSFEVNHSDKPMIRFSGRGIFVHEQDAATPTNIPYVEVAPPAALGATLTWKSVSLIATQVIFDLGNDVQLRPSMGSATGFAHAVVVDRDPSITIDPEDELVATLDFVTHMRSIDSGVAQLLVSWGEVAGNRILMDFRQCQLVGATPADKAGLVMRNLSLKPRRRTTQGNDFLSELRYF